MTHAPDPTSTTASGDGAAPRPSLAARLDDPDTSKALHRLLDRLDAIERSVTALTQAVEQAPLAASTAADMFDDAVRQSEARTGVAFDDRTHAALDLAERLTEPDTARVLGRLLDRLDQVDTLLDAADQVPNLIAMGGDVFDETMRHAMESGVDVERAARQGMVAFVRLGEVAASDEFKTLLDSGVLDCETVTVVGKAGQALVATQRDTAETSPASDPSLFSLLTSLRDPDVKRALGFLTRFAKHFGRAVSERR